MPDYNGNGSERDGADKIQIIGVKALSQSGKSYIRLVFIDRNGLDNVYHNAALFLNEKKEKEAHPDYYGSVDLDRDGHDRLRLAAWIKTGERAGKYLSISVSEGLPVAREKLGYGRAHQGTAQSRHYGEHLEADYRGR